MRPDSVILPALQELECEEIKLSSIPLIAAGIHMGKYCDYQCKDFMLCHTEHHDPRKCLNQGKEVTKCGMEFLRKIKDSCNLEFSKYYTCLRDIGGNNVSTIKLSQSKFDTCVKEFIGQDRPETGYFNRIRLIKSSYPRPSVPPAPMPERTPDLPDFSKLPNPTEELKRREHYSEFLSLD